MRDFIAERNPFGRGIFPRKINIAENRRLTCSFCGFRIEKGQEFTFYKYTNICNSCIRKFYEKMDKENIKKYEKMRIVDMLATD